MLQSSRNIKAQACECTQEVIQKNRQAYSLYTIAHIPTSLPKIEPSAPEKQAARSPKTSLKMAYSRSNESKFATFPRTIVPFGKGTFKQVWRGHYTDGPRKGQECVSKAFNTHSVFDEHYFQLEMRVVRRAQEIIDAWNAARVIDAPVVLNVPSIWSSQRTGQKRLVEPFIRNFQKFNSNGGWVYFPGTPWSDALQALSHFSYHLSGGQMLLCDIQGGIYSDGL